MLPSCSSRSTENSAEEERFVQAFLFAFIYGDSCMLYAAHSLVLIVIASEQLMRS